MAILPQRLFFCLIVLAPGLLACPREVRSAETAAATIAPRVEELRLETSDGIRIAAWFYPAPDGAKPVATVILVHDLEGSHKTVEKLAESLQRAGYAVVAPDLRAHGASGSRPATLTSGTKGDDGDPRALKRSDLESIAAATGGRLRDQCAMQGEIEAVRNWINHPSAASKIDIDRLCIVGCGVGGTLASMWTVADWNWPPKTDGPQGQQVRAIALVSPVWASKGVTMSVPLTSEAIQHRIPIMVLAGKGDRDAIRLFEQLKRLRPSRWFQQRVGQPSVEKAKDLEDPATATTFFLQSDTSLTADKLANDPDLKVGEQIQKFFALALAQKPE